MKQNFVGSCHCGRVKYKAQLDVSKGTFKCNCSICSKSRSWLAPVSSEDFTLVSGEEVLTDYQFGKHRIHHLFCKHCGIKSFGRGTDASGKPSHVVNITCLDNADFEEFSHAPIMFFDGLNDNFKTPPEFTGHL